MGKPLFEVVPGCLHDALIEAMAKITQPVYDQNSFGENAGFYLVHFETGKRVDQLYAELDQGDDNNADSLAVLLRDVHGNASYLGPWAFQTLGGAGGQTVFGALTTGTHGGDFRSPPIADSVMAMHLVADAGRHYWIEPKSTPLGLPLTDDAKLTERYGKDKYKGNEEKGTDNFEIIRDDDVFNSVLVAAGRFGIVYSVVMRAVRQYSLHEERRLTTWNAMKAQVTDLSSDLYRITPSQEPFTNRFLQIAISVIPHANSTQNLAGVTKRWNVPAGLASDPATGAPSGRAERVGVKLDDFSAGIQGPLFAFAGHSHAYSPDPNNPGAAADPSFFEQACTNANFLVGIIEWVMQEIKDFIDSNGEEIGWALGAVATSPGAGLLPLIAALLAILALLAELLEHLASQSDPHLGQQLNHFKDALLSQGAAGILVWQMIAYWLFSDQQKSLDFAAISYAVMDRHDYFDQSCNVNVDSIEVFFDATDPMLIAFVDALLTFEVGQEINGKSFVGYISLRFTGSTRALLGEQRHSRTCAVEVAGLRDVSGVKELMTSPPRWRSIRTSRESCTGASAMSRLGPTCRPASATPQRRRAGISTHGASASVVLLGTASSMVLAAASPAERVSRSLRRRSTR